MNQTSTTYPSLAVANNTKRGSEEEIALPQLAKNGTEKKKQAGANASLKETMRNEIAKIRAEREMANNAHAKEVREKEQRIRLLRTRSESLRRDFHKHVAVHRYASELKEQETPSYIVILQAKLCREVHHMCVDDAQLKLLHRTTASLAKFANKQLMDLEQEQSQLEVEVLNAMAKLEVQQKELQEEYNEKVHQQRLEVVHIQKKVSQDPAQLGESGIDNLMDRLSILNTKLKQQTEPQEEIPFGDFYDDQKTKKSKASLDEMLGGSDRSLRRSSWGAFPGSWSKSKETNVEHKTRRGSMFSADKWRIENRHIALR